MIVCDTCAHANIHTHTQTYTHTGTDLLEDYARAQTYLEKNEKERGLSLGARGLYLKLLSACYTASDSMSRFVSQDTVGASKWRTAIIYMII